MPRSNTANNSKILMTVRPKKTGLDQDVKKFSDLELRNLDRSFSCHPGEPQIKGAIEREMNRRGIRYNA